MKVVRKWDVDLGEMIEIYAEQRSGFLRSIRGFRYFTNSPRRRRPPG